MCIRRAGASPPSQPANVIKTFAGQEGGLAPALQFQISNFKSQISDFKPQFQIFKFHFSSPQKRCPTPGSDKITLRKSGYLSTFRFPDFRFRIFAAYKKIDSVHFPVYSVPDLTPVVPECHAFHLRCTRCFVPYPSNRTPQKTGMLVAYYSHGRSIDLLPIFS